MNMACTGLHQNCQLTLPFRRQVYNTFDDETLHLPTRLCFIEVSSLFVLTLYPIVLYKSIQHEVLIPTLLYIYKSVKDTAE